MPTQPGYALASGCPVRSILPTPTCWIQACIRSNHPHPHPPCPRYTGTQQIQIVRGPHKFRFSPAISLFFLSMWQKSNKVIFKLNGINDRHMAPDRLRTHVLRHLVVGRGNMVPERIHSSCVDQWRTQNNVLTLLEKMSLLISIYQFPFSSYNCLDNHGDLLPSSVCRWSHQV